MANWEYVGYSSPHTGVYEQLDAEIQQDPLYFLDVITFKTEVFKSHPEETNQYYNDLWVDILT